MKAKGIFWSINLFLSAFTGSVYGGFEGNLNILYSTSAGHNTTGDNQSGTFVGVYAGYYNTTGIGNIFLGDGASFHNTTAPGSIFIGFNAGANEWE